MTSSNIWLMYASRFDRWLGISDTAHNDPDDPASPGAGHCAGDSPEIRARSLTEIADVLVSSVDAWLALIPKLLLRK
jgi:hypothetical protein